jgi:hypothetical protein
MTLVNYPIVGALVATEAEIGSNRTWESENDQQAEFLRDVFGPSRDEVAGIPELKGICSRDHEVVNAFLRQNGFSIQLNPMAGIDKIAAASILKLALEWAEKGTTTNVTYDGKNYPAVKMGAGGVRFYECHGHQNPVCVIRTKSGDDVGLTMLDSNPLTEKELALTADRIFENLQHHRGEFAGLVFPMVDLDMRPDISWLLGMKTMCADGLQGIISQALQQTRFAMDEVGARVESAAAVAVSRGMSVPQVHVINRPFIAVVNRDGLRQNIFTGYIAPDSWKRPARN